MHISVTETEESEPNQALQRTTIVAWFANLALILVVSEL